MNLISKSLITSSIALCLGFSVAVSAQECILPNSPIIPDGNVASQDELVSAKDSYSMFESKIIDYRECLIAKEAEIPADSETAEAQKEALLALDTISYDNLQKVADEFNQAVRSFKER